jgi:Lhr-like helicase
VITKTLPDTNLDIEKKIRKEEDVKARKIIIYSVRDHLLPHIANMKTTYDMYEALKGMFESDNTLKYITLKSQFQSTKMTKGDTVSLFFMKLSDIKEQLETIGEIMSDREIVLTTLHNLPKSWETFIQSISGREALPTFDRLWTDCTKEEIRLRNRGVEDSSEENHALSLHTKKGVKFKRNLRKTFKGEKSSSNPGYQRRDDSEI